MSTAAELKLNRLAATMLPVDKRGTHSLSVVHLPEKKARMWTSPLVTLESSSSESSSGEEDTGPVLPTTVKKLAPLPTLDVPLHESVDIAKVPHKSADLLEFEARMTPEYQDEYRKRVKQTHERARKQVERRCRRKMRRLNRKAVFDKSANSTRVATLLHVETLKHANIKVIEVQVLQEMLDELLWRRAATATVGKVRHVEEAFMGMFDGTSFQRVTKQGARERHESLTFVPRLASGLGRRWLGNARASIDDSRVQKDEHSLEAAARHPQRRTSLSRRPSVVPPTSKRPSSRQSSRPVSPITGSVGPSAPPSPKQMYEASMKTREDMRVTASGRQIAEPTINAVSRSQPVFIQHLQGVTPAVRAATDDWAAALGAKTEETELSMAEMAAKLAAGGAVAPPTLPLPAEPDEYSELLLKDRSALVRADVMSHTDRRRGLQSFNEFRHTQSRERRTVKGMMWTQRGEGTGGRGSTRGHTVEDFRSTQQQSDSMGIPDATRRRALGKNASVSLGGLREPAVVGLREGSIKTPARVEEAAPNVATPRIDSPEFQAKVGDTTLLSPNALGASPDARATSPPADAAEDAADTALLAMMKDVFARCEMHQAQRLDFLVKYSQPEHAQSLREVVTQLSAATDAILVCEKLKALLRAAQAKRRVAEAEKALPAEPPTVVPSPTHARPGDTPPGLSPADLDLLTSLGCFVPLQSDTTNDGTTSPSTEPSATPRDGVASCEAEQTQLMFAKLCDYIKDTAHKLYLDFDAVLSFRGVDYAALAGSKSLMPAEHSDPFRRRISKHLQQ